MTDTPPSKARRAVWGIALAALALLAAFPLDRFVLIPQLVGLELEEIGELVGGGLLGSTTTALLIA